MKLKSVSNSLAAIWWWIRHPRTAWELISRPKTYIWPLLGWTARNQMPWAASRLLLMVTGRAMPSQGSERGQRQHCALILNFTNAGVRGDIESVFLHANDYGLITWPSYALRAIARSLLASGLDHNNYVSNDVAVERSKANYRRFLRETWNYYRTAKPVDVVIAGNYAYAQQREFGAALEEAGTPFIAIHKENVRPPRRVKQFWLYLYKERRGPFAGRRIIVYNEVERDLQISAGVFDADRIVVAGMPRLDRIHRWRREQANVLTEKETPQILLFSFSPQSKLTAPGRKRSDGAPKGHYEIEGEWGRMSWAGVWKETHSAIIRLARERPDWHVVIKIKGRLEKETDFRGLLEAEAKPLPANLEIVSGGDPFDLIASSRVVVGFNTTGLLEAIAAGKPVIVPRFSEAADADRQDLVINLREAVKHASSADHLLQLIAENATQQEVPTDLAATACERLRYWVGNDDGGAGSRALKVIRDEVAACKSLKPACS